MFTKSTTPSASPARFLIIGYGDEHRGDEGVGSKVAKAVESWQLDSVHTLVSSQLNARPRQKSLPMRTMSFL